MNEKIDLTEILKDCPEGTKLYSTIFGEVEFKKIEEESNYPIVCVAIAGNNCDVTADGRYYDVFSGECILFPSRDQRDWTKFTAPWYKKERDNIAWLKKQNKKSDDKNEPKFKAGDWLYANELNNYANLIKIVKIVDVFGKKRYKISRDYDSDLDLAEFDFIEKHYHLWTIQDARGGDVLAAHECYVVFKEIDGLNIKCYCTYHYLGFKPSLYIGTVQNKDAFLPATKEQHDAMMKAMNDAGYEWNAKTKTLEKLSEPKFDPKTLNLFDKVLVKISNESFNTWYGDFVAEPSHAKNETPLILGAKEANMVIPYNDDTKHLIGTSEEAPEFYRYWED